MMQVNDEEIPPAPPANPPLQERLHVLRPPGHSLASAIVSGDSEDIFDETSDDEDDAVVVNPSKPEDLLYDHNLDEEDEAYVYKHLRGGIVETVTVRQQQQQKQQQQQADGDPKQIQVYKPRNSDAVLSCPCCFTIVCMDCQRHQRYLNQFRAMFVMGITVDWHARLIYDDDQKLLVPKPQQLPDHNNIPPEQLLQTVAEGEFPRYEEGEYFSVQCANCKTQVAALDMTEEVYHFHGCLESA